MKHLIMIAILLASFIVGCGDKTTINGYSEEDVSKLLAENRDTLYQVNDGDSILTYIYVTDTLYKNIVDTVYNRVTDTVFTTLVDTITTRVIDTIMTTLVDTVYNKVIDTVVTTLVDTIYTRVIDTVFSTLEEIGVDTELPRDTSITMSTELNGATVSKTFYGIVYKGVFFDTTVYQYADTSHVWVNDEKTFDVYGYLGNAMPGNGYMPIGSHYRQRNHEASGLELAYDVPQQCGSLTAPNMGLIHEYVANKSDQKYQTPFAGWRMLNDSDAYKIQSVASHIIPDYAVVFTSLISSSKHEYERLYYYDTYIANVITSTGVKTANKPLHYMCVYDLNK